MNEYWQADSFPSFCFCRDGVWFQAKQTADDTWQIFTVTVEGGLPTEMKENYYHEVELEDMLSATGWTESRLETLIATPVDQVD